MDEVWIEEWQEKGRKEERDGGMDGGAGRQMEEPIYIGQWGGNLLKRRKQML